MKRSMIALILLLAFVCTTFSYAAENDADLTVSVNLKDLPVNVANEIIKYKKETSDKGMAGTLSDPNTVQRYTEIGRAIALSLKEACTVLSVEVNSFVTTPVGKITTALIVYRVAGKDIIKAVIFALFSLFLYITMITSFVLFFKTKKTIAKTTTDVVGKGKETKESVEYVSRYNFKNNESRAFCAVAHLAGFVALTVVVLTNLF